MVEAGDGPGLLLEPGERTRPPGQVRPQHLHRQPALKIGVDDFVDLGEATATHETDHPVGGPERAGEPIDAIIVRRPTREPAGRRRRAGPDFRGHTGGSRCFPSGQEGVTGRADQQGQIASAKRKKGRLNSNPRNGAIGAPGLGRVAWPPGGRFLGTADEGRYGGRLDRMRLLCIFCTSL